jgi:hypothetical protein
MGHSSLLGVDFAPLEAEGRDSLALGPSDTSDSGSDIAGIDELEEGNPMVPIDVALRDDIPHRLLSAEALTGASDSAGTGERRSAGSDAGLKEGADIGVDHVFSIGGGDSETALLSDEDLKLAALAVSDDEDDQEDEDDEKEI